MAEERSGWAWFAPPPRNEDADADAADLCRCAARVFAGPDGARLLEHLRAATIERRLGPEASEAALRHLEGQRALVAWLAALIARGRNGNDSSKE